MRRLLLPAILVALLLPVGAFGQTWREVPLPDTLELVDPDNAETMFLDVALDGDTVWFSTLFDGIMGYDGIEWKQNTVSNSGLRSNAYRYVMFVDKSREKWTAKLGAATVDRLDDGGTFTDKSDDQWTYYSQPAQLNSRNVFCMAEDMLGNKWFGIRDENHIETSIIELLIENGEGTDDDLWLHFGDDFEPDIFFDDDVRRLAIDDSNRLWIVYASNGVDVWDFGDYESFDDDEIVHHGLEQGLPSNTVRAVHMAEDGRVWLGTDSGLAYLDPSTGLWTVIEETFDLRVFAIDSDSQGHMWVATDHGVTMVYRSTEAIYSYDTVDGLRDESISLIAVDKVDGTVWAVSVDDGPEPEDVGDTHLNVLESGFGPEPPPESESSVFAYPNPWRQNASEGYGIKVLGAPDGSSMEIFDITGQSVRKLPAALEPFDWDLLDESGNKVPSGVYILRVEDPDGVAYFTRAAVIR
ncbi:MAG: T9SS type A sorting domain-containing protein [Candidatus Eisenbacteria bacterium]|nr:T9SS type A sorting domain-containing protein [Candidatus Eisenbacteria bacterium]